MVPNHFYTIKKCADEAGVAKSTILRQVKAGKLSAQTDDQGRKRIDPAEFHRVYPKKPDEETDANSDAHRSKTGATHRNASAETADAIALVRTMIETADKSKEEEIRRLQDTIEDLRDRLDRETAHSRSFTLMLTDQRTKEPETEKRSFFSFLTG